MYLIENKISDERQSLSHFQQLVNPKNSNPKHRIINTSFYIQLLFFGEY